MKTSDMLKAKSTWEITCHDKGGNLKWVERVENLVTTEGLDFLLNTIFAGSAYTALWYVGLKGAGVVSSAHTLASHPSWSEITDYLGNRQATTFGTASGQIINNVGGRPEFDMTNNVTVHGMFLTDVASGSGGILLSVVDFASPRAIIAGDVLRVTVSYQATGV